MELTNLLSYPYPLSPLREEEINVLQLVLSRMLDNIRPAPTQGSFVLDARKYGEAAKCVLRFDLEKGPILNGHYSAFASSEERTNASIDAVLEILQSDEDTRRHLETEPGLKPSLIITGGDTGATVCIVNATKGQFIAGLCADIDDRRNSDGVLFSVARALELISGKPDLVLRKSIESLNDVLSLSSWGMVRYVEKLFSDCTEPEIVALKEYQDSNEKAPFFA